jgi:Lon protease-like protein
MSERLPLFPLGTVLVPGLLLPLNIFEQRYRELVQELESLPAGAPRRFGVVAIQRGREVGATAIEELHEVGCTAEVRRIDPHADGRYRVIAVGGDRFRLAGVDRESRPYLVGEVDFLGDPVGDEEAAARLVPAVGDLLRSYLERLGEVRQVEISVPDLPDEPLPLSYLVAATVIAEIADRQALLAAPDAVARLQTEQTLLRRELALLTRLDAVTASDLTKLPLSPN